MPSYIIPNPDVIRQEILASHERCKQYGINPLAPRNRNQIRLTDEELRVRRGQHGEFLKIATTQMQDLYQFVAGAGFAVTIADQDGYILEVIGDAPIVGYMEQGNCCPGYRWTERDVGTSVISLVLERRIPFQVNDDEHYCERGHGFICSASPVFDETDDLIGIIAMSGLAMPAHPHTLGMVITAARAIERQLRILQDTRELALRNSYMNAIIEAIDSGVMTIDRNGVIRQINKQGLRILEWDGALEGQPLSMLLGAQIDLRQLMQAGFGYTDREVFIRSGQREIHVVNTAKPICNADGQVQGIIIIFNEIKRIRKLVNAMVGSQAKFTFENIIGESPTIQHARTLAMQAAAGDSTVLLLGETGTGKELFAQAIHNKSGRKHHPFMAINCGAIPRDLLESELFGYTGGAFTGAVKGGRPGKFELASGGTIFLDEIGDMPTDMQVKLLRVLQTGEVYRIGEHKPLSVNVRIINAMMHPAPTLLNTSMIESERDWLYYYDGITPSIGAYVEAMDLERVAIGKALGLDLKSLLEWYAVMYDAKGETLSEAVKKNRAYAGVKGQKQLKTRYVLEDIPMGLVPEISLGKLLGIPTPRMETVVQLGQLLLNEDFTATGRTLDKLSLAGMSAARIVQFVETGEGL